MSLLGHRRRAAVAVLAAPLLALPASRAWAHADFVRSDPAPGSTLERAPARVTAYFSEEMEPAFSSMSVVDAQGRDVTAGPSRLTGGNRAMEVALKPGLPPGTYTVRWKNLSTDGHSLSGSFTFRVTAGGPAAGAGGPGGTGGTGAGATPSPAPPAPSAPQPPAGGTAARPAPAGGGPVLWAVAGLVAAGAVALAVYRLRRR